MRAETRWRAAVPAAIATGLLLSGTLVWHTSNAAFSATSGNAGNSFQSGGLILTDNDGGTALFTTASNLAPGSGGTACIDVTYKNTVDSSPEATLRTNITGPWYAQNGTWTDVAGGKQGNFAGDAFYLSRRNGSDFTYEGDVTIGGTGLAAALTFRATADASSHYTLNIDKTGFVKLWRPGRDIAIYNTPITVGRTYHLKVVAAGSSFTVYLDRAAAPVITATDTAYASGYFGANVVGGTGVVQNLSVDAPGFSTVRLTAAYNNSSSSDQSLAPYLGFKIEEVDPAGSIPSGESSGCTTLAALYTVQDGAYLADTVTSLTTPVNLNWAPSTSSTKRYRFSYTLAAATPTAAQNRRSTVNFTWTASTN